MLPATTGADTCGTALLGTAEVVARAADVVADVLADPVTGTVPVTAALAAASGAVL